MQATSLTCSKKNLPVYVLGIHQHLTADNASKKQSSQTEVWAKEQENNHMAAMKGKKKSSRL